MSRTIRCTVIEILPNSESRRPCKPRNRCFDDLVPWADPYILALVEKLRSSDAAHDERDAKSELPPPLTERDDEPSQADWSRRDRPRE